MPKPTAARRPSAKLLTRLRAIAEMPDARANDSHVDAMQADTTDAALQHVAPKPA